MWSMLEEILPVGVTFLHSGLELRSSFLSRNRYMSQLSDKTGTETAVSVVSRKKPWADLNLKLTLHPIRKDVVPLKDDVLGERICVFVTLAPNANITFEEMTGYLGENGIAKMRWPERIEIVDEMPMTPTRKIQKGELAKLLNIE